MSEKFIMNNHPEEKSILLFQKLFPNGFSGKDVFDILADGGWENSELHLCFHPTIEQQYVEAVRVHERISSFNKEKKESKPPTLEEIRKDEKHYPIEPKKELQELIGYCLWDIFSDNHEVFDENGIYEIGSFRGSAGFIAEYLNQLSSEKYSYVDFYMGSIWIRSRADLFPVHRLIFQRLKEEKCFWKYAFPKLGILDLSGMKEEKEDSSRYSPEKSFLKEKEKEEKQKEIKKLQNKFDKIYEEEKKQLKANIPKPVKAYHEVYGKFPEEWEEQMI